MFRYSPFRSQWRIFLTFIGIFVLVDLGGLILLAQMNNFATLTGIVRDSKRKAVSGATVDLSINNGARQVLTVRTDHSGRYTFASVHPGSYSVHATMKQVGVAENLLTLAAGETKQNDLTLHTVAASSPQPQFFDAPQFEVAGITHNSAAGGHGSDNVLRTTETLAKATVSLGNTPPTSTGDTEQSLRQAVSQDPENPDSNYHLGKMLLAHGKGDEAVPYLERAASGGQNTFSISYDLARAYAQGGDFSKAAAIVQQLLIRKDISTEQQADLHHLTAEIEEKQSDPLGAVRQYEIASKIDPSERNVFDWGAELLVHRGLEPAAEVFRSGAQAFPESVRMLLGLSAALFAQGSYEDAAKAAFKACDLDPTNSAPYLFLGRIQSAERVGSVEFTERFASFVRLQPDNALADYYYAVSLSKLPRANGQDADSSKITELLTRAVTLDPTFSSAYLQLGILYSEKGYVLKAIEEDLKASQTDPDSPEPHYRLAQLYRKTGDTEKAANEFQLYKDLSKKDAEAKERERRELQKFIIKMRDGSVVQ